MDGSSMLKVFIARTVVITGLNYLFLRGSYIGGSVMDSATVGAVGALGAAGSDMFMGSFIDMLPK